MVKWRRQAVSGATVSCLGKKGKSSAGGTVKLSFKKGAAVTAIVNWTLAAPMPPAQQAASGSSAKPAEELLHDMTPSASPARRTIPQ